MSQTGIPDAAYGVILDSKNQKGSVMKHFTEGDIIGIRCSVKPGPFSDEKLVEFDTVEGVVSGFVSKAQLRERGGDWFLHAEVLTVQETTIEVWVDGSFFTTNGIASISQDIALAA